MKLDIVTLEVIRNALPAVANEMAADLQRTSYNMMIYEVRDFCTAVLSADRNSASASLPCACTNLSKLDSQPCGAIPGT